MSTDTQLDATDAERRLSLFLHLLDEEARQRALEAVPAAQQELLRRGVEQFNAEPPSLAEAEAVIDEFERVFRLLGAVAADQRLGEAAAAGRSASGRPPADGEPAADNRLETADAARLAAALRSELPQTVSIVLRQLSAPRAGEVLARLPAELRGEVVLRLKAPLLAAPRLVEQVVQATLRRAAEIDPLEIADERSGEQKMAEVLRAMPRKDRQETMQSLGESDPELAEAVQNSLYEFEDLLRIDDRSVQALLAEVDTESLALAVKEAPEEFLDKVVRNLSKRAGETLSEEVAYMQPPGEEEQFAARRRVVQLIAQLDQQGKLRME